MDTITGMLNLSQIKNLAITGANGFVGKSVVDFVSTLDEKNLPSHLTLITRNGLDYELPEKLSQVSKVISQDLTLDWAFEDSATHILNLAADGSKTAYSIKACEQFSMISNNLVAWIERYSPGATVFHASTGACFGYRPLHPDQLGHRLKDDFVKNRIQVENFLVEKSYSHSFDLRMGRLFSFSGKNILNKSQYAFSHFIKSAISMNRIEILGNPETQRSYLHESAMSEWILKALITQESHTDLQIGSELTLSLGELAQFIGETTGAEVCYPKNPTNGDVYVATNVTTRNKLGVVEGKHWKEAALEMIIEARRLNSGE